jgi:hypothetical protein
MHLAAPRVVTTVIGAAQLCAALPTCTASKNSPISRCACAIISDIGAQPCGSSCVQTTVRVTRSIAAQPASQPATPAAPDATDQWQHGIVPPPRAHSPPASCARRRQQRPRAAVGAAARPPCQRHRRRRLRPHWPLEALQSAASNAPASHAATPGTACLPTRRASLAGSQDGGARFDRADADGAASLLTWCFDRRASVCDSASHAAAPCR